MIRRSILLASTALLLASCAVGPDFLKPSAPPEAGYTPEKLGSTASANVPGGAPGGARQRFVDDKDISGQWWTVFHSEPLNQLIEEALKANPTLDAAQATLRQAQENVAAQKGVFFPGVSGDLSTTREKISGASFGNPNSNQLFTLTTGSVSVSYGIDIFGGERRQLELTEAQAEYQRYQLEAAYLTITSNVVAAAI